jgi:hypothetical protein
MPLLNLFRKPPKLKPYITIVSGLPRSGTSMMMQILEAGGIQPITDQVRQSDSDNSKGYYEHEAVKQLEHGNHECLQKAEGSAVKVISALLQHLPGDKYFKVIFMSRNMEEVLASQKKMLINLGHDSMQNNDQRLKKLYTSDLAKTRSWLMQQKHIDVLYIDYADIIDHPKGQLRIIEDFLDLKLNNKRISSIVDQSMRHHNVNAAINH